MRRSRRPSPDAADLRPARPGLRRGRGHAAHRRPVRGRAWTCSAGPAPGRRQRRSRWRASSSARTPGAGHVLGQPGCGAGPRRRGGRPEHQGPEDRAEHHLRHRPSSPTAPTSSPTASRRWRPASSSSTPAPRARLGRGGAEQRRRPVHRRRHQDRRRRGHPEHRRRAVHRRRHGRRRRRRQLSTGLVKLSGGADQLADGTGQLADGLKSGAKQIPTYDKQARERLSTVVAAPVASSDVTSVFSNVATTTLLAVLALWVGGLASYLVLRAVSARALSSMKPSWRLSLESLLPAAVVAVVQSVVLTVLLTALLDLGRRPDRTAPRPEPAGGAGVRGAEPGAGGVVRRGRALRLGGARRAHRGRRAHLGGAGGVRLDHAAAAADPGAAGHAGRGHGQRRGRPGRAAAGLAGRRPRGRRPGHRGPALARRLLVAPAADRPRTPARCRAPPVPGRVAGRIRPRRASGHEAWETATGAGVGRRARRATGRADALGELGQGVGPRDAGRPAPAAGAVGDGAARSRPGRPPRPARRRRASATVCR